RLEQEVCQRIRSWFSRQVQRIGVAYVQVALEAHHLVEGCLRVFCDLPGQLRNARVERGRELQISRSNVTGIVASSAAQLHCITRRQARNPGIANGREVSVRVSQRLGRVGNQIVALQSGERI